MMKKRPAGRPAVFLDRDGVIVRERNYLSKVEHLSVLRGVPAAMKALRKAGFKVVVVTNQSGVARGYFTLAQLGRIHRELKRRLAKEGAKWDALYFSPHGPDSSHPWRKPGIGMLKAAQKKFRLDLKSCYFVGDTTADVQTALNAGCTSILVRGGQGGRDGKYPKAKPDATVRDLPAAVRFILSQSSHKTL